MLFLHSLLNENPPWKSSGPICLGMSKTEELKQSLYKTSLCLFKFSYKATANQTVNEKAQGARTKASY